MTNELFELLLERAKRELPTDDREGWVRTAERYERMCLQYLIDYAIGAERRPEK